MGPLSRPKPEQRRRLSGAWISVREAPANRATSTGWQMSNEASRLDHQWNLMGYEVGELDLPLPGHRAETKVSALLPDIRKLRNPVQVHNNRGRALTEVELWYETLASSEHPRFGAIAGE